MIKKPRILLIEDNQGDAELTREVFEITGQTLKCMF